MHNNPPEKSGYFLNSLAKGLRRLQVIAAEGQAMSLTEIARSTNVSKASATRLCYTLTQLGFLQKDRRKCDRLTPKTLERGIQPESVGKPIC